MEIEECKGKYMVIVIEIDHKPAEKSIIGVYRATQGNYELIDENIPRAMPGFCNEAVPGSADALKLGHAIGVELKNEDGTIARGNCRIVNTTSGPVVICR